MPSPPGNWAPRVIATTWKLLIEKALGNLLLTYLMCLTKGKKQTKPEGLVSNPSLYSAWPVEKQCFLSQERISLTLDCLSLGRSQWVLTSLNSSLAERAGGPWGNMASAWEGYSESHRGFCYGTQLWLLAETSLPCNVPGCPPPLLGSA